MNVPLASLGLLLVACTAVPADSHQDGHEPNPLEAAMSANLPDFDSQWNYGDPAGTEAVFREIQAQVGESAPLAYRAELATQIARTQGLQRQFDAAHATLDQVDGWLVQVEGEPGMTVARVRALLERGRAVNSAGDPERAGGIFLEAFELGSAQPNSGDAPMAFHVVDAAHMLGIVEKGAASEQWNLKALELAQASTDPRAQGWQGSLTNNLGWTYHDQGRYEEAYDLFAQNRAYWLERDQTQRAHIAKWCMGRTLRSLGKTKQALAVQNELLAEWSPEDGGPSGYVYEELGECTLLLESESAARPHFAKAYAMLSQDEWLQANEAERLARLAKLGGVTVE